MDVLTSYGFTALSQVIWPLPMQEIFWDFWIRQRRLDGVTGQSIIGMGPMGQGQTCVPPTGNSRGFGNACSFYQSVFGGTR